MCSVLGGPSCWFRGYPGLCCRLQRGLSPAKQIAYPWSPSPASLGYLSMRKPLSYTIRAIVSPLTQFSLSPGNVSVLPSLNCFPLIFG